MLKAGGDADMQDGREEGGNYIFVSRTRTKAKLFVEAMYTKRKRKCRRQLALRQPFGQIPSNLDGARKSIRVMYRRLAMQYFRARVGLSDTPHAGRGAQNGLHTDKGVHCSRVRVERPPGLSVWR
jgi:hypothetical protein